MQKLLYAASAIVSQCFMHTEQAPLSCEFIQQMVMDCDGTIVVRRIETTHCSIKFP